MLVFVSEEFNLGTTLEDLGVFDSLLDEDSNYFINIKRLKSTKVPEFVDSYKIKYVGIKNCSFGRWITNLLRIKKVITKHAN